MTAPDPLNLDRLRVRPLDERRSLSRLEDVLVEPANDPPPLGESAVRLVEECAGKIMGAVRARASVMVIYGAHLVKNGGQAILVRMLDHGWVTHLATNGAGAIHDWEFSYAGKSTEDVRANVAQGCFGAWDETGRCMNLAVLAGGLRGEGLGQSVGRLIQRDGLLLPSPDTLADEIAKDPAHPLTPARAEMLTAMRKHLIAPGAHIIPHPWRNTSVLANAFRQEVPLTVHPGIGYDIITNHPMFNGAAIGRAAAVDFRRFAGSVETLDNGVVLSIGTAIMGPQVFEKSLSCVNNLRLVAGRPVVNGHTIYVVDLQDGGNWDWSQGEPPKTSPAYYLRFCKSYSRMGGVMRYVQCDNIAFLHNLQHALFRLWNADSLQRGR